MTDLELNGIADGVMMYLRQQLETPRDALAVLGFIMCKLWDGQADRPEGYSFEQFAEDFKLSLIDSYKDASAQGTGTMQ